MNTKFILPFILLFLAFTNCNNDDDSSNTITINGTWNLTKVSGGLAGINDDFDSGTILWTFNETTSMLTVINTDDTNALHSGLISGDYTYSILNQNQNNYLIIDNQEFGGYILSESILEIDANDLSNASGADGFGYTLER